MEPQMETNSTREGQFIERHIILCSILFYYFLGKLLITLSKTKEDRGKANNEIIQNNR